MGKRGSQPETIAEIESKAKKHPDEPYLSTGEVSRLLAGLISRSTVTRLFDRGVFDGRVNPITGERQIKWRAVKEWLKRRGLNADKIAMVEKQRGEKWIRPVEKGEDESD